LRVVDDADERLLLGRVGQQAENRQPDEKALGGGPAPGERCAERLTLRLRQSLEMASSRGAHNECRPAKASSISARRLSPKRSDIPWRFGQLHEECGLAATRLATKTALDSGRAHARNELVQDAALAQSVKELRGSPRCVEHGVAQ